MPIVGSFAGASSRAYGLQAGVLIGDFESIATSTVGSGGTSYVEFSSISSTYKHLQIRGILRTTTGSFPTTTLQFNSDTGNNYSWHQLLGDGAGVAAAAGSTVGSIVLPPSSGSTQTASVFGIIILDILEYSNTNIYKTIRAIGGVDNNGSGQITLNSGNWRSTSTITSIKIIAGSGNFAQYSSFSLYGIKG